MNKSYTTIRHNENNIHSNSLGIKGKLIIGFTAITIFFLLATGITTYAVNSTKLFTYKVISIDLPSYNLLLDINNEIYKSQVATQTMLLSSDDAYKEKLNDIWNVIDNKSILLNDISRRWTNINYIKLWEEIKDNLSRLHSSQLKLSDTNVVNNKSEYMKIINSEINPTLTTINNLLNSADVSANQNTGIIGSQSQQLHNETLAIIDDLNTLQLMEYILSCAGVLSAVLIAILTFRAMNNGIETIAKEITHSSHNIVSTLEEVRHAVDIQSTGASEQASSINEITASLTEIEKSSTQTMDKAKSLGEVAERTREKGQLGLDAVDQSVNGMKEVREKVQIIAQTILDLSNQTQQVGEITAVVNNLAQQSKMLALNASIEAAKAGEAGKGFAVVANEVKNLAEQSEQSTTQVQKILEDIRHAAEKAVMVTEEGTKGVDHGTSLVEQTGDIIRNLNDVIHETTIASQQIESAVRQESAGIEQITAGMNEINQVTTSFVDSVKQTTEAIASLATIAKDSKDYVDTYKL